MLGRSVESPQLPKEKGWENTLISKTVQGQNKTRGPVNAQRGNTFHLLGTPDKAAGNPLLNVFCRMADVMATPQTVPKERIRYTVDAETAWSAEVWV